MPQASETPGEKCRYGWRSSDSQQFRRLDNRRHTASGVRRNALYFVFEMEFLSLEISDHQVISRQAALLCFDLSRKDFVFFTEFGQM